MPRILIIGATGYIGNALALSPLRSGDRSPSKKLPLFYALIPSATAEPGMTLASSDVLLMADTIKKLGQERLDTVAKEGAKVQKLGLAHVCGIWVHGDSKDLVSDTMPVGTASAPTPPLAFSAARVGWEQTVLKTRDVLDVVIVRPGLVPGGTSWVLAPAFHPILKSVQSGATTAQLPFIAGTGVYPVFDLTTSHESFKSTADGVAKALGLKGKVEYAGPGDNPFFKALTSSTNCDSARARQLLGWAPKRFVTLHEVDIYARAWMANIEGVKS
ncbi:hypothetical protein FRC06_008592 [Ceratobasidium sp. 370]|nr:hypothetical protein FRC06_008592 [Ceratobasidium sp. 370]